MKKVIAIFLAAILIFSLAACGGTSGDTNSKTTIHNLSPNLID